MKSSETTKEIFGALVQAKAEFKPAVKASVNPHFKASYADLATVVAATEEALSKNGLCVLQSPQGDVSRQSVTIVTRLAHISGEWIEGELELPAINRDRFDPQSVGSAITYARRYALMGMLGIAAEDDDAASATHPPASKNPAQGTQTQSRPIAQALRTTQPDYDEYAASLSDADDSVMEQVASPQTVAKVLPKSEVISEAQGKRFYAIAKKSGKSDQQIKDYIGSLGYEHTRELPWKLYKECCAWAEGK